MTILIKFIIIAEIQSLNPVWLFATLWTAPGFSFLHYHLEFPQIHIHWVSDANNFILYHPLLLLLSFFTSIRVFSNEFTFHIKWPKYWNFSFSISSPNEYSGLSSFSVYWLDLLVFQGTLKSLLQHHTSKASILQCSTFCMVQLSHLYMTTGVGCHFLLQWAMFCQNSSLWYSCPE